MKKLYLFIAASAMVGSLSAQSLTAKKNLTAPHNAVVPTLSTEKSASEPRTSEKVNVALKQHQFTKTGKRSADGVTTDTLANHFVGTPALYRADNSGYVAGHNGYGDISKMQKFDPAFGVSSTGNITKVLFYFGYKTGDPASTITVKIWDDNAGEPGNVIGSVDVPFSQITTSALTEAVFASPVAIPANKTFYAGFSVTYSGLDTVGLVTTSDGDFAQAATHTWEEWDDGTLATLGDPDNWDLMVALGVFPVVELDGGGPGPGTGGSSVYFHEDFENGIPAGFAIVDVDGRTVSANIASLFPTAWSLGVADGSTDQSVLSTSWYTPAGQSDDWIITDTIIIPDTASSVFLSWEGEAIDPDYPDGYEVRISNTTKDVAGCLLNPAVFTISGEEPEVTPRKVDISSYIGDTIFVAFRNNSTDMFILSIDEIKVYEPSAFDIAATKAVIDSASFNQYTRIPAAQAAGGSYPVRVTISNVGASTPAGVTVHAQIKNGATVIYTDSVELTATVPTAGGTLEVTMPSRFSIPASAGTYSLQLTGSVTMTESDGDMSNNSFAAAAINVAITDTTYARDNNASGNTSLSIGGGLTGHLGMVYDVVAKDTLSSVTVVLRGKAVSGRHISVSVFEFNGGPASSPLVSSNIYEYNAAGTYVIPFNNGVELTPGQYLVTINELDSSVTIGTTTSIFTPGTVWIKSPGIAGNSWNLVESFGANYARTFFLRPNFGNPVTVGLNNNKALDANVTLFPNPSNGISSIVIASEKAADYKVSVVDMLGRVIKSYELNNASVETLTLDLSNEANGIYFVRVQSGDASVTKKLSLNK